MNKCEQSEGSSASCQHPAHTSAPLRLTLLLCIGVLWWRQARHPDLLHRLNVDTCQLSVLPGLVVQWGRGRSVPTIKCLVVRLVGAAG